MGSLQIFFTPVRQPWSKDLATCHIYIDTRICKEYKQCMSRHSKILYKGECIRKHKKQLEKTRVKSEVTRLVLFNDVTQSCSINLKQYTIDTTEYITIVVKTTFFVSEFSSSLNWTLSKKWLYTIKRRELIGHPLALQLFSHFRL